MGMQPKALTLINFASAQSGFMQAAVTRGWISGAVPVPKISTQGESEQNRTLYSLRDTYATPELLNDIDMHTYQAAGQISGNR